MFVGTLSGCDYDGSKSLLCDILEIDDLSGYEYKSKSIRKRFSPEIYTYYFKIDISEDFYQKIKEKKFDILNLTDFGAFESFQVKHDYYANFDVNDIPIWFDIGNTRTDFELNYSTSNKTFNYTDFDVTILFKYREGYCYMIVDGS